MSTENIVTGKYYRILKNATSKAWDRISFWTHADDVELSSGATLSSDLTAKQTKIDATLSDFAQVEKSPSTHAYTKGQMLIYNNKLYRVKAAIAVGNTLTVGTNIELVSVSTLSSMLTANTGNAFYFDVKDGAYGFYPTASKTASTFVPFGGTNGLSLYAGGWSSSQTQYDTYLYKENGYTDFSKLSSLTWYDSINSPMSSNPAISPSNDSNMSRGLLAYKIVNGTLYRLNSSNTWQTAHTFFYSYTGSNPSGTVDLTNFSELKNASCIVLSQSRNGGVSADRWTKWLISYK